MLNITTLPIEILSEIFCETSSFDFENIKRTCKLFHSIAQRCHPRICIFKVDAAGHPAWRMIRPLLKEPKPAEHIREIKVEWHRRNLTGHGATGTEQWEWTPDEITKIRTVSATSKIYPHTTDAILAGINSEALLPFLLCLTPNLESLDLGAVQTRLVVYEDDYTTQGAVLKLLTDCLKEETRKQYSVPNSVDYYREIEGLDSEEAESRVLEEDDSYLDYVCERLNELLETHVPYNDDSTNECLWFHKMFDSTNTWPPIGLGKLTHFSAIESLSAEYGNSNGTYENAGIFGLPRIQSIRMGNSATSLPWEDALIRLWGSAESFKATTLKRLELYRSWQMTEDILGIAKATSGLEYVAVVTSYCRKPDVDVELVGRTFLANNPKLKRSSVYVRNRSGDVWGEAPFDESKFEQVDAE
ncbi:hypothetical protein H072_4130 [Dactylellina haptotyla CBS 200.50]|uniref:F-box domain-containing protein n=1 Tax=Dactylellina haptotyla (strain CBS 200.50) TaxID=1284197 RepID=S8ALD3_DACHA|nr:hypothetical protein H072_4130 [Dactylellina haptotyla CBS 200.50]